MHTDYIVDEMTQTSQFVIWTLRWRSIINSRKCFELCISSIVSFYADMQRRKPDPAQSDESRAAVKHTVYMS